LERKAVSSHLNGLVVNIRQEQWLSMLFFNSNFLMFSDVSDEPSAAQDDSDGDIDMLSQGHAVHSPENVYLSATPSRDQGLDLLADSPHASMLNSTSKFESFSEALSRTPAGHKNPPVFSLDSLDTSLPASESSHYSFRKDSASKSAVGSGTPIGSQDRSRALTSAPSSLTDRNGRPQVDHFSLDTPSAASQSGPSSGLASAAHSSYSPASQRFANSVAKDTWSGRSQSGLSPDVFGPSRRSASESNSETPIIFNDRTHRNLDSAPHSGGFVEPIHTPAPQDPVETVEPAFSLSAQSMSAMVDDLVDESTRWDMLGSGRKRVSFIDTILDDSNDDGSLAL
jgi:hypothetical protein